MTQTRDPSTGQLFDDGAGRVRISPDSATTKNRLNNPDATPAEATNRITWTPEENVTELYIWIYPDAQTVGAAQYGVAEIEDDDSATIVFDSISYADGNVLLAATGGAAVTVQMEKVKYNTKNGPFNGTSYFSSLQFDVPVNSKVYVEAQ